MWYLLWRRKSLGEEPVGTSTNPEFSWDTARWRPSLTIRDTSGTAEFSKLGSRETPKLVIQLWPSLVYRDTNSPELKARVEKRKSPMTEFHSFQSLEVEDSERNHKATAFERKEKSPGSDATKATGRRWFIEGNHCLIMLRGQVWRNRGMTTRLGNMEVTGDLDKSSLFGMVKRDAWGGGGRTGVGRGQQHFQ